MTPTLPLMRGLPKSLTHPTGIFILAPQERVSRAELDKADAQWRALREAAYARAWAEDATLVGSCRSIGTDGRARRRRKAWLRFLRGEQASVNWFRHTSAAAQLPVSEASIGH